jgi:peptidoglycan/LPS O-acetylase OafA/YrhL
MSNQAKRIDAVDGLRAIAVLPVILFHLNPSWLPGGYLGVDIFFVISGYLITGIIVREITENTFSFTGFYRRRIRRILPALMAMMAVVLATCVFLNPIQLNEVARQTQAVIMLNGNGALCDGVGNYWGANALADPLLHTWSLGVEEQFYLLFPLLIWLLVRYQGIARTFIWVLAFGLISFAWFLIQSAANPPKAFYLLLPRAWELMAGAVVALAALSKTGSNESRWQPVFASWFGMAVILTAYLVPDIGSIFQRLRPLIAVPGVMLFLWGSKTDTSLSRVVAHPSMIWVGLVSYSLYLWHWPVIVLLKIWNDAHDGCLNSWSLALLALGVTVPLALASYRWIEQPLRRIGSAWIIILSTAVVYAAAEFISASFGRQQLSSSQDPASMEADAWVGGFRGMTCRGGLYSSNTVTGSGNKLNAIRFIFKEPPRPIDFVTVGGDQNAPRSLLFWGDSHAAALASEVDEQALRLGYKAIYHVLDGGDPTPTYVLPETGKWIKDRFRDRISESEDEINRFNALGRRLISDRPDVLLFVCRYDGRLFERMRPFFEEVAKNTKLLVVQQPPVMDIVDVCTIDYFAFQRDRYGKPLNRFRVRELATAEAGRADFETKFRRHFGANKNVVFIPTQDLLKNPDGSVKWWDGHGALYYIDTNHLSPFGANLFGPRIAKALSQTTN